MTQPRDTDLLNTMRGDHQIPGTARAWTRTSAVRLVEHLRTLRPETAFVALALVFGTAVLFANAPFQSPDEPEHFFRVFQLTDGAVMGQRRGQSSGGPIPYAAQAAAYTEGIAFHPEQKMTSALFAKKFQPLFADWAKEPRGWCHFPHTVLYAPVGYGPQVVALGVGRLFHLGPLLLLYIGRLAAFAFFVALGSLALRRLPAFRWSLLVVLLSPMSLYIAGSIAPDGILNASAFVLAAIAAQIFLARVHPPSGREQLLLLCLGALLTVAKAVYFPLACAAALVVLPRLRTNRQRWVFGGAFVVLCIVPALAWSKVVAQVYTVGRDGVIDPVAQSHVMLHHPLEFLLLTAKTLHQDGRMIYEWFVGTLGWGDTPLPQWYYAIFAIGFVICVAAEAGGNGGLPGWVRLSFFACALGAFLLTFVSQYLTWNSVGSHGEIEGICGRYFLPLVPFVLLALPPLGKAGSPPLLAKSVALLTATTGCLVCLSAVVLRYYVT